MNRKKTSLTKRFAKHAVIVSTLLMALLCVTGLLYLRKRPQILHDRAEEAMNSGNYREAIAALEKMEKTEETEELLQKARYGSAEQLLLDGRYEEAEKAFSALGDYSDARTRIQECRYGLAALAMKKGDYLEAKERFYALSGYSDALIQYNAARYAIAAETEIQDPVEAFQLFYDLGDYSDASAQAERIAVSITGMEDPEDAVNLMLGVSEEEILTRSRLESVRVTLPKGVLSVGFYHTVGLKKDGTVVATGSNSDGQCNVAAWTGIQAIDCGAFHTVGLKGDGTVVATGRNASGQCNVTEWRDIVAVACTDYDTIGLKRDGTVVTTGYHDYSTLSGWTDVVSIAGGSYSAVAVTGHGQLLSSHPSSRSEAIRNAVEADASTGYAVCLLENGMVAGTAPVLSDREDEDGSVILPWSEIVSISASSTGVLAINTEGKILSLWFRERDSVDLSDLTDAVAVAAGGTHSAVLKEDGTVVTRGNNEYGECETSGWNLGS